MQGDELDQYVEKRTKMTELGEKIGGVVNLGRLGFDYRSLGFDPRDSLQTVESPGLYLFGEYDILVLPEANIERMNEIFNGNVPDNLTMEIAKDATHIFKVVNTPCDSVNDPMQYELSTEVVSILDQWLAELGY